MAPASTTSHLSPAELSYLHSSLSSQPAIRPDARNATDFRPFSAELGILPNTMGSAHVGFADGREAVVGVRAEVERTTRAYDRSPKDGSDVEMANADVDKHNKHDRGRARWVSLTLALSGLRDDDKDLIFLEEMLREVLVAPSSAQTGTSLQDALVINNRWHWHLYVDVVLISPPSDSAGSYPLPLLSMAIHLALRDTRIPRLKSEGEEDPLADDDWEASTYLYERATKTSRSSVLAAVPPVTLLVTVTGDNVLFDPSGMELAVADGVFAVSISHSQVENNDQPALLAVRMLDTGARDTMMGVAAKEGVKEWESVPGVWRPKVGGVKRAMLTMVVKAVLGEVGKEVLDSLSGFVAQDG